MLMAVAEVIYSSRKHDIEVNGKPTNSSWFNTIHQITKQEWKNTRWISYR